MTNPVDLTNAASNIWQALLANHPDCANADAQVFCVAEEAGEFVGAYRRATGRARRSDTAEHVVEELADVVISSFVAAQALNADLGFAIAEKLGVVFTRGWKETP